MYSITAHAAQVSNLDCNAVEACNAVAACMQAAHASVLHRSTSVLHSTSTTALLDKGQQVCKQPCIALPLMLLK